MSVKLPTGCITTSGRLKKHIASQKILPRFKIGVINAQSVKNKTTSIHEYIIQEDFDILAITETWLDPDKHSTVAAELLPPGYNITAKPRPKDFKQATCLDCW